MAKHETEEYTLTYDSSQDAKDALWDAMLGFYMRHEAFSGESIYQRDTPQIKGLELIAEIADELLQFKREWKDDQ